MVKLICKVDAKVLTIIPKGNVDGIQVQTDRLTANSKNPPQKKPIFCERI